MFFVPKFISHLKFSFSLITINTYANNYREKQDIGGWPKTEQIIHVQCRYVCLVKQLKMVYIDHFQPVTTASIVQFHQSSAQDSTFFFLFGNHTFTLPNAPDSIQHTIININLIKPVFIFLWNFIL